MTKIKIAFKSNQLGERGTEVALYDYARYNEEILGNKSIILSNRNLQPEQLFTLPKFMKRFEVFYHDRENQEELDRVLKEQNCTHFYHIKSGRSTPREPLSTVCKNLIHAVFDISNPHGDRFAAISEDVAQSKVPFVPHMIDVSLSTLDLKKSFDIPSHATVIGCGFGGTDQFNVKCARETVQKLSKEHDDIYFLMLNVEKFTNNPHVIFIKKTYDKDLKRQIINTCDAFLHARLHGETFGIAVGEWSMCDKPVMTYQNCKDTNHIKILKDRALQYADVSGLESYITTMKTLKYMFPSWDAYSKNYNPTTVMNKFKEVFLDD